MSSGPLFFLFPVCSVLYVHSLVTTATCARWAPLAARRLGKKHTHAHTYTPYSHPQQPLDSATSVGLGLLWEPCASW